MKNGPRNIRGLFFSFNLAIAHKNVKIPEVV